VSRPTVDPAALAAARRRLEREGVLVLFEDHLLIGLSKAAGVLSQGGPAGERSLVDLLDAYRRETEGKPGRAFVGLVHRLDRNVSGAMVVAKSSKAAARLAQAFREREGVEKTYLAWVAGTPPAARGTLRGVLERDEARRVTHARPLPGDGEDGDDGEDGGRVALLDWEVEARGEGAARLRVRLHTGRTHQVRAQLSAAGMPLFGDAKYGGADAPARARCARPALHAARLVVPHPVGGAPLAIEAPPADDLLRLDAALGLSPPAGRAAGTPSGA
jgi:23S rRNA pseudouridine1911/1915/1917 synthase